MDDFLTVKQVAKRFNVSVETIHRWRREGHFPGAKRKGPGKTSPYIIPDNDVKALERKLAGAA